MSSFACITDCKFDFQYYFGDANLAKDKFMKEQIAKDDGWIPLSVLLTFNRLKAMSEDADAIIESVNKSAEGLVEVSLLVVL